MIDAVTDELLLDQFLPYRLSVLSNRVSQAIAAAYGKRFELTIPAWRVMAILNRYSGLAAADLVEKTAMDKVAISRAVSHLLERGYITRDEHAGDRRRWLLNLSEAGQRIYRQIVPLAQAYERDLLESFSEEETAQLHGMLDRLSARAMQWKEKQVEGEYELGGPTENSTFSSET